MGFEETEATLPHLHAIFLWFHFFQHEQFAPSQDFTDLTETRWLIL